VRTLDLTSDEIGVSDHNAWVRVILETCFKYARTMKVLPVNCLDFLLFTLFHPVAAGYSLITARKAVVLESVIRFS
jgi:hypothetical protein